MKKLTDFELATLSAIPCLLGDVVASATDIAWAFKDFAHSGLPHLMPVAASLSTTLPLFVISGWLLWKAWKKHKATGQKMVQGPDDIDYRIALYLQKKSFERHVMCERVINNRKGCDHGNR